MFLQGVTADEFAHNKNVFLHFYSIAIPNIQLQYYYIILLYILLLLYKLSALLTIISTYGFVIREWVLFYQVL